MSDESTVNGADAEGRERPSWYVPIQPREPGAPTTQELLKQLQVVGPDDDLGDAAADIDAYLERILRKGER